MSLVLFPVLLPLLGAAILMLLRKPGPRLYVAVATATATLAVSLTLAVQAFTAGPVAQTMSNWPAPFGITLIVDGLSAIMIVLSGVVGLLTVFFTHASLHSGPRRGYGSLLNRARELFGAHALFQFLFMGVNLSFITADVFNLFVAFEVMLIASYGLLLLGGELPQLREGLKYVVINLLSSTLFVGAAGLAYGLFGTLNMADIAERVALHGPDQRITAIALLMALVFATKTALFPFGFWLPNSYPVPMTAASAFFAAMLTKVGAYALIRLFTLMFPEEILAQQIVMGLAAVTVLVGALGAVARHRWRYIASFINVASISMVVVGTMAGTQLGLAGGIYYMINSVLVVFALFLIAALAERLSGSNTLKGGHLSLYPWLGVGFFIVILAIAGLPPTSGFIGKFAVASSLFALDGWLGTAAAVAVVFSGIVLLYAGVQVWMGYFWGDPGKLRRVRLPGQMVVITTVAVLLVAALPLVSGPVYELATSVAGQLDGNEAYLAAVFPQGNPALDPALLPELMGADQ